VTIRPASGVAQVEQKHLPVAPRAEPRPTRPPGPGVPFADPYPLSEATRRVLYAVICAMCPPAPAPRSAELLQHVELGARRLFRYMHPFAARALSLGLLLLDVLPLLTLSSRLRLHRLPTSKASAFLSRCGKSPIKLLRLLIQGARGVVLGVYFDQKEVHSAMKYAPVPFMQGRVRLRAELLRPVHAAAE
jgi:hypothetical protein